MPFVAKQLFCASDKYSGLSSSFSATSMSPLIAPFNSSEITKNYLWLPSSTFLDARAVVSYLGFWSPSRHVYIRLDKFSCCFHKNLPETCAWCAFPALEINNNSGLGYSNMQMHWMFPAWHCITHHWFAFIVKERIPSYRSDHFIHFRTKLVNLCPSEIYSCGQCVWKVINHLLLEVRRRYSKGFRSATKSSYNLRAGEIRKWNEILHCCMRISVNADPNLSNIRQSDDWILIYVSYLYIKCLLSLLNRWNLIPHNLMNSTFAGYLVVSYDEIGRASCRERV